MLSPAVLAKFRRANEHISELRNDFVEWNKTSTALNGELSADGLTFRLDLVITKQPDLERWSLIFGDAIHNMRVALDIWMWERIVAESKREPKSIYFPIRVDEKGFGIWEASARRQGIREETILALRTIQPFLADSALGQNVLRHIHELDIADKHKHILELRLQPQSAGLTKVSGFMQPDPASDFDIVFHPVDVTAGGTIVEVKSSAILRSASVEPQIQLIPYYVFKGLQCELWENLEKYSIHLRGLLAIIEGRIQQP